MNTTMLIKNLAQALNISVPRTQSLLQGTIQIIERQLLDGKQVYIPGLGTIGTKPRPAREVYNPATRQKTKLPETRVIFFHPSTTLKEHAKQKESLNE